jgi:hypothetical protein
VNFLRADGSWAPASGAWTESGNDVNWTTPTGGDNVWFSDAGTSTSNMMGFQVPEIVNNYTRIISTTLSGSSGLGSANTFSEIRSYITQATASQLMGNIKFYVNDGDDLNLAVTIHPHANGGRLILGDTTPLSGTNKGANLEVHDSGGTGNLPAIVVVDDSLTMPNYSGLSGWTPNPGQTGTVGQLAMVSSGYGGMSISGFTEGDSGADIAFIAQGYHGYSGTITVSPVRFVTWKWNGSTNRTALAATEPCFDWNNGTTNLMKLYGDGDAEFVKDVDIVGDLAVGSNTAGQDGLITIRAGTNSGDVSKVVWDNNNTDDWEARVDGALDDFFIAHGSTDYIGFRGPENDLVIWQDFRAASGVDFIAREVYPVSDGAHDCGTTDLRWQVVYCDTLTETSDIREKNIQNVQVPGLDFIRAINPFAYKWDPKYRKSYGTRFGFSAQAIENWITGYGIADYDGIKYNDNKDSYSMSSTMLIPVVWQGITDVDKRIDKLQDEKDREIKELKRRIAVLEAA